MIPRELGGFAIIFGAGDRHVIDRPGRFRSHVAFAFGGFAGRGFVIC